MKVRERLEGEVNTSETVTVDLVPEVLESEDTEMTGFSIRDEAFVALKRWLWPPLDVDSFG
jgi:hypothetical protein